MTWDDAPDYRPLSTRHVTARKEHTCVWCGKCIGVGEKYYRHSYLEDGDFRSVTAHEMSGDCILLQEVVYQ